MPNRFKWPGGWNFILTAVLLMGAIGLLVRCSVPIDRSAAEEFPWGVSAALNIFCGLSLAAGGFAIAATLSVLQIALYRPVLRGSLLLAYLGFAVALLATLLEYRVTWRSLWNLWSPRSIPAGAVIAFWLYSVVIAAEFVPSRMPQWQRLVRNPIVRYLATLLTCLAAIVAALQQMSFLKPVIIAPQSFSPMWATPVLPLHVYCSAACACLALLIFAYWHVAVANDGALSAGLFNALAHALCILLMITVGFRMLDFTDMGQWRNLLHSDLHDYLFGLELVLLITPALFLLNRREGEDRLAYDSSIMVIAGFMVNRLNTVITSREVVLGIRMVPSVADTALAIAITASAVAVFSWIVKHVPVFA